VVAAVAISGGLAVAVGCTDGSAVNDAAAPASTPASSGRSTSSDTASSSSDVTTSDVATSDVPSTVVSSTVESSTTSVRPGGTATTAAPPTAGGRGAASPAGSDGCGTPPLPVDDRRIALAKLESSGGTREYLVVVPPGYDPQVPAPLAYVFHGATSNKEQQLVYSDFTPEAAASGALLVLPDALGTPKRWSPLGPAIAGVEGVDDLAFFDDLHDAITSSWCVDTDRVLVSGMSSGGFMAAAVGCLRGDVVSAIGPVTATVPPDRLCPSSDPVPYVYFHGTADMVVPFGGGPNTPGSVEATSQAWADHNDCTGVPVDERIGTEVIHRSWTGCAAPTDLYIVEGGGHTWPGAIDIGGGLVTRDIDATAIIWETFLGAAP
jgi:polyhydroxybutyrate depolymerase